MVCGILETAAVRVQPVIVQPDRIRIRCIEVHRHPDLGVVGIDLGDDTVLCWRSEQYQVVALLLASSHRCVRLHLHVCHAFSYQFALNTISYRRIIAVARSHDCRSPDRSIVPILKRLRKVHDRSRFEVICSPRVHVLQNVHVHDLTRLVQQILVHRIRHILHRNAVDKAVPVDWSA